MKNKDFLVKHIEKYVVAITVCYLVYGAVYAFIVLQKKTDTINTRLTSLAGTVERRLATGKPPAMETELTKAAQLESRFMESPQATILQNPQIFYGLDEQLSVSGITVKDLMKKQGLKMQPHLKVETPGDTEFVYKGGTENLALIQVRKLFGEKWWTESFIIEKGKTIGEKKTIGKGKVDFSTNCKLKEIIPYAQKPMVIKKTAMLQNENGEFIGTTLTEETHMISTSRIVFENKKGESYNLWVGELVNLGTETPSTRSSGNTSSNN